MEFVIFGVVAAFGVMLLIRNNMVYWEKTRIADEVRSLNRREIDAGLGYDGWRWEAFDAGPSYDAMLFKFWRPVSSFYRDAPFLKERQ